MEFFLIDVGHFEIYRGFFKYIFKKGESFVSKCEAFKRHFHAEADWDKRPLRPSIQKNVDILYGRL
jgi:hypothetical protein